jgi:HD superfamily phosphodiesterase
MISESRWQHILGVARKARSLAACLRPDDTQYQEDMFLLGMLHDFGYEFSKINTEHAHTGGQILKRAGYRYWREVFLHGDDLLEHMSDELFILNLADMTTLPDGKPCNMEERVKEIANRYGKGSPAHDKARHMYSLLCHDERYLRQISSKRFL